MEEGEYMDGAELRVAQIRWLDPLPNNGEGRKRICLLIIDWISVHTPAFQLLLKPIAACWSLWCHFYQLFLTEGGLSRRRFCISSLVNYVEGSVFPAAESFSDYLILLLLPHAILQTWWINFFFKQLLLVKLMNLLCLELGRITMGCCIYLYTSQAIRDLLSIISIIETWT